MTSNQLRLLFIGAAFYLFGSIAVWSLYAAYLLLTGRT